jgi:hypothetical protein
VGTECRGGSELGRERRMWGEEAGKGEKTGREEEGMKV